LRLYIAGEIIGECELASTRHPRPGEKLTVVLVPEHPEPNAKPLFALALLETA
jgi:hypothetical protein